MHRSKDVAGYSLWEMMVSLLVAVAITGTGFNFITKASSAKSEVAREIAIQAVATAKEKCIMATGSLPDEESKRFAKLAPYLTVRGLQPSSMSALCAGTGWSEIVIGDASTPPFGK